VVGVRVEARVELVTGIGGVGAVVGGIGLRSSMVSIRIESRVGLVAKPRRMRAVVGSLRANCVLALFLSVGVGGADACDFATVAVVPFISSLLGDLLVFDCGCVVTGRVVDHGHGGAADRLSCAL
jgi:hypothetical protein